MPSTDGRSFIRIGARLRRCSVSRVSEWTRNSELLDAAALPAVAHASMGRRWAKAGFEDEPMDSFVGPIVRTESVNKKGFFGRLMGGDARNVVYGVLLRRHLLIVVDPGEPGDATLLRELRGLEVVDYETSPQHAMIPDRGLTITTGPSGTPERASYFLPLGGGDAAQIFREALETAVHAAH